MRFDINLASHPYQDASTFYRRWVTGFAILALISIVLCGVAVSRWNTSKDVISSIRQMEAEMQKIDSDTAASRAILDAAANKPARLQAQFLNTVIARKSFSWTRTFSDLERIMPAQVHLISLVPQLDEENRLEIHMVVGATSHEKAIELLTKLEHAPQFQEVSINSEGNVLVGQNSGPDRIKMEITALYVPVTAPTAALQRGEGQ